MGQKIPWTFESWISRFENVDLPIGDLAKDIASDENFPTLGNFETIYEYISLVSKNVVIIETFCLAWNFFIASTREYNPPTVDLNKVCE